jgi:hypothetical protein
VFLEEIDFNFLGAGQDVLARNVCSSSVFVSRHRF